MRAFHGDPEVKAKYLRRVINHQRLDSIVQGTYWEDHKGCAVGCTLHSPEDDYLRFDEGDIHVAYESELGLPEWVAELEDFIFEQLTDPTIIRDWPLRFLEVIPVGARYGLEDHARVLEPGYTWLRNRFQERYYQHLLEAIDHAHDNIGSAAVEVSFEKFPEKEYRQDPEDLELLSCERFTGEYIRVLSGRTTSIANTFLYRASALGGEEWLDEFRNNFLNVLARPKESHYVA